MEGPAEIDMRCSVIVVKNNQVLLVHRARDGADDWVLPGGTPRPGESMASCARRETLSPPLAGYLRALHAQVPDRTAAYLGNLWRPDGNGTPTAAAGARTAPVAGEPV